MNKRVGLIAENSISYINALVDIWNNGDCAVLVDWRIPHNYIIHMLKTAGINECYTDSYVLINELEKQNKIQVHHILDKSHYQLVPHSIYEKFQTQYNDNEAIILFSSGTTGQSKGCILTHNAIQKNADAIIKYMDLRNDSFCIVKSLSHSSTIVGELLVGLKTRSRIFIGATVISPKFLMEMIVKNKVSVLCLNPTLLQLYSQVMLRTKLQVEFLNKIYVSGSIATEKLLKSASKAFPSSTILNVYGLTECGPRVSAQTISDAYMLGSVGKPVDKVAVKIISEDGQVLNNNQIGLICVNTPYHYSGYLEQLCEPTSLYGNWINTRDLGYMDQDGFLYIVGRYDNMISHTSHNVYPEEVEQVLCDNAPIQDCLVVGQDDEMYGQKIICFYTGTEMPEKELKHICNDKLATYEVPNQFIWIEKIPLTSGGKKVRNIKNILEMLGIKL